MEKLVLPVSKQFFCNENFESLYTYLYFPYIYQQRCYKLWFAFSSMYSLCSECPILNTEENMYDIINTLTVTRASATDTSHYVNWQLPQTGILSLPIQWDPRIEFRCSKKIWTNQLNRESRTKSQTKSTRGIEILWTPSSVFVFALVGRITALTPTKKNGKFC